jgi:hypothetical protein
VHGHILASTDPRGLQEAKFDAIIKRRDRLILSGHADQVEQEDKWRAVGTVIGLAGYACAYTKTCGAVGFFAIMAGAKNENDAAKAVVIWAGAEVGGYVVGRAGGAVVRRVGQALDGLKTAPAEGAEGGESAIRGAAASPKLVYRENAGGAARTLEEAKVIAAKAGVTWDEDLIEFTVAKPGELTPREYARYLPRQEVSAGRMITMDFLKGVNGKVVVKINPSILTSDEKIMSTIAHESYEIDEVEMAFKKNGNRMRVEDFRKLTDEDIGTAHCEAWDHGDAIVEQYRNATQAPPSAGGETPKGAQ